MGKKVIPTDSYEYHSFKFDQFQEALSTTKPIYITGHKRKPKSLALLLWDYLVEAKPTNSIETGGQQCTSKKRRSREDLYLLLKKFYPEVTFKYCHDVLEHMRKNWKGLVPYSTSKVEVVKIKAGFCSQVRREVYTPIYQGEKDFEGFEKTFNIFNNDHPMGRVQSPTKKPRFLQSLSLK